MAEKPVRLARRGEKKCFKTNTPFFPSKYSGRIWGQLCEVMATKSTFQTLLGGAEINLLTNYLKKRTEITKDRSR